MTPEDIEHLFQTRQLSSSSSSINGDNVDALSAEEKASGVAQLKQVLLNAQNASVSGSKDLELIAEKLANGSRDVSWRVPIGDSGLLDYFLSILSMEGLPQSLVIHALRLIGNSCADTDENRARLVESEQIPSIVKLFANDALLPFLIPVMYNVCLDYGPAQLAASKASLSSVLVEILSQPRLDSCRPFLNIICKILKLLISQESETRIAKPTTPIYLLEAAVSNRDPPDLEDFCGLTSVALAYLTHVEFQTYLLNSGYCELLMQCFEDSYRRFEIASADAEEAAELKQIWIAFVQVFADISASPDFASQPLDSPLVQRLVAWLGRPMGDYSHLQTAACLSLGNLARSDETSTALLKDVYGALSAILTSMSKPDSQLLHAVLSFLKNLAIPAPNKPILGQLLLEPANGSILSQLWPTETQPQTQFAAISLTRLLVSGCSANVSRLCVPLSPGAFPPGHERTPLRALLSTTSRADAEPTKLEGARTAAAVCKALHTAQATSVTPLLPGWGGTDTRDDRAARHRFYSAHEADISKSLADLLTQRRFPALRSESLFTIALMSRSPDGAGVVCRALYPAEACGALIEAVTGKRVAVDGASPAGSSEGAEGSGSQRPDGGELDVIEGLGLEPQQAALDPAQSASVTKIDRENGLVLVVELLKQDVSVLPPSRRAVFEELLKTGGEMVISERQKEGSAS